MALSGSFNTSSYNNRHLTFSWTATQSIANNTTTISWTLKGAGSKSGYYLSAPFTVVIDGETVYHSESRIQLYSGTTVASGTKTITHTSNGSRSFSASVSAAIYMFAVNCSGSGSWTLDTIPRAGSIDSLTGSTDYLDGVFTYKYTPKSNVFYNRLRVSIPNVVALQTVDLGAKSASQQTATYSLSTALLESIYTRYPNASTCTLGFVIETYSDSSYSSKIGESVELTIQKTFPLSVAPTIGNIVWTKTSNEPSTWPITQGVSKGTMAMTGVEGKYGSTITSYSLTFAGLSSTTSSLTVNNITSTGTLKAIAVVTDSRGRPSAPKEVSFTVAPYSKPQLTVSAYRSNSTGVEDDDGDYISVKATATVTAVGNNSLQSLVLQYKKRSDSMYSSVNLTSGTLKTVAASSNYTWDWIVTATDRVYPSTANDSIGTGEVVLDIMSDGSGIGLGKVAEIPNAVDSAWNFAKGGNVQTDLVVEQGTSGSWSYRKWASGVSEAWTTSELSFTATPQAIMGGYYTASSIGLPGDVFKQPPTCFTQGRIGTGLGFVSVSSVSSTSVNVGVFGNQNSTTSYVTSIYAIGIWK